VSSLRFTVSPQTSSEDVLACFRADFGIDEKAHQIREEVFLDSFDWRLYEAGLLLCVTKTSRRNLSLLDRDTREPVLSAPLKGRKLPRFVPDFTDEALAKRLDPLLRVRAADPVATVTVNRQPFALLDELEKTVVCGALESFSHDGANTPFLVLLTLSAVRGYDKALEKAHGLAEAHADICMTEQDFLSLALQTADRKPGDYTSKLDLSLEPDMSQAEAAAGIFTTLADTIERNLEGTIANTDSEFLHDFRVAVRRTRSALSLLKQTIPAGALGHFGAEFSWLGKVTGPVRDLDVYLLAIDDYDAALPAQMRGSLEAFRTHLSKQHRRESLKLAKALQSDRFKTMMDEWRDFLSRPHHWRSLGASSADEPIKALADARIWKTFRTMESQGRQLNEDSPADAFHNLRKRAKKMRYALEFFRSLYPDAEIKPLIKELKAVQQVLGDYQDFEVQAQTLEAHAAAMTRAGDAPAPTLLAMGSLVGDLVRRQAEARDGFAEVFAAFSSDDSHKAYKKLFKPAKPKKSEPSPSLTVTVEE